MLEAERDPDARANNIRALDVLKRLGCTMHEVALPSGDLSYFIEYVERAAAFDSLTRDGLHRGVRQRTGQYLRACQLVTAVDYLQANRRRLAIMADVAKVMATATSCSRRHARFGDQPESGHEPDRTRPSPCPTGSTPEVRRPA